MGWVCPGRATSLHLKHFNAFTRREEGAVIVFSCPGGAASQVRRLTEDCFVLRFPPGCCSHLIPLLGGPGTVSLCLVLRVGPTRMDLAGVPVITEPWCWTQRPGLPRQDLVWFGKQDQTENISHITQPGHTGPGLHTPSLPSLQQVLLWSLYHLNMKAEIIRQLRHNYNDNILTSSHTSRLRSLPHLTSPHLTSPHLTTP